MDVREERETQKGGKKRKSNSRKIDWAANT